MLSFLVLEAHASRLRTFHRPMSFSSAPRFIGEQPSAFLYHKIAVNNDLPDAPKGSRFNFVES